MAASPASAVRAWRWPVVAAAAGFASSFLLSGMLGLSRAAFVAGHSLVVVLVIAWWVRTERIHLVTQFSLRWRAGAVVGVAAGVLLMRQVFSQPGSARPDGAALLGAIAWYGLDYGIIDAMLLSVLPVIAVYGVQPPATLAQPAGRLRWGAGALVASAAITVAYHLGFAEFRGLQVLMPVLGNTVITLAYLLSGSPVAPVVAHVLMHVAAVTHGMATTVQLPPHG